MRESREKNSTHADDWPKCWRCGCRDLIVIYEVPHPLFGRLGMTLRTLRCNVSGCGKLTVV
jgi:hypothetical protein